MPEWCLKALFPQSKLRSTNMKRLYYALMWLVEIFDKHEDEPITHTRSEFDMIVQMSGYNKVCAQQNYSDVSLTWLIISINYESLVSSFY